MMAGGLRRDLGLGAATSVVVGSMIGVGIFLGPREIAVNLATPGLVMLAWVLGGLFVFCGALSFAELGGAMPESGGQYAYMREAYGPTLAYLTGWSGYAVGKAASVATLAVAFTEFAGPALNLSSGSNTLLALAVIALVMGVNIVGVRHAGRVAVAAMIVKIGAIALLVAMGLALLGGGVPSLAREPLLPTGATGMGILSAFGLALIPVFFAYDGWSSSTQVAEEVRDPARNVPRSVILGTLGVVIAYALVNLVYFLALGTDRVGEPGAAARTAVAIGGNIGGTLIVLAILVSIVGTINAVTLSGPRIAFAMSRDGLFFRNIEKINRWGTPGMAIMFQSLISAVLVMLPPVGDQPLFSTLLTYVIVDSFIFYALGALAVIILRRKRPDLPRPYKVPFYPVVPMIFVLGSLAFLINAFATQPRESIAGVLIVLAGLPGYYYWRHANRARIARSVRFSVRRDEASEEPKSGH